MVQWISLLTLTIAVSLDSFGVGLTYGVRKMKIPLKSIVIIACCSAATLLIAMSIGNMIQHFLSESSAERIGGIILIGVGAFVLYQVFQPEKSDAKIKRKPYVLHFEIKSLGIVIQILRKPLEADIDNSGTITGIEAILLGVALSLDAFGAGIGAALMGFSPFITAGSVAIMSSIFVLAGMRVGHLCARFSIVRSLTFLPGMLLIILGVLKI
jgi:putative sporulation protein YtaF